MAETVLTREMAYAEDHRSRSAFGLRIHKALAEEGKGGQNLLVEDYDVHYLSPYKLVSWSRRDGQLVLRVDQVVGV